MLQPMTPTAQRPPDLATLDDFMKDLEPTKEEKRQMRRKLCGRQFPYRHPEGDIRWFRYACGDFRNCPRCKGVRADRFRERALRCAEAGDVVAVWLAAGKRRQLHGLGKDNFWFIPSIPKMDLVFVKKEYTLGLDHDGSFPVSRLTDEDWLQIAATPQGRNQSGGLGREAPKVNNPDEVVVKLDSPVVDGLDKEQVCEALNEATDLTSDTKAEDVDSAIKAHKEWAAQYAESCQKRGGKVKGWITIRIPVQTSCIGNTRVYKKFHPDSLPDGVVGPPKAPFPS